MRRGLLGRRSSAYHMLLENPESPAGRSELEDERDEWSSCPPSKRNESKGRMQLDEQAASGGG